MLMIAVLVFMLRVHYRNRPRYYTQRQLDQLRREARERDSLRTVHQVAQVDGALLPLP